ncbi:transient receptor potential cation channel subfamily A member 1 [Microdochium nivale]|nr:transient receptor potential cation channel subfamily A member 1 [Microdochium nivale]
MTSTRQEQRMAATAAGDIAQLRESCQADKQQMQPSEAQFLVEEAIKSSQLDTLDYLLTEFPETKIHDQAIKFGAMQGSVPLFQRLVLHDPSITTKQFDRFGTALTSACRKAQPVEFLKYLLNLGADPNQSPGSVGYPIALAAAHYDDTAAMELLLEHGAKLEQSGTLSLAARLGNEANMRYLLDKVARPDTDTRPRSDHPLHNALWGGHVGAAKLLLDHGSSTTVLNRNGQTLEEIAAHLGGQGQDRSVIMGLIAQAEADRVQV